MQWDKLVNINNISEIRTASKVFLGVGAIEKIDFISAELKKKGVTSVLVMTGKRAYETTGAWAYVTKAFEKHGLKYTLYNQVEPNPETHQVDAAVQIGKDNGANAVLSIGGGSPIDAGKSAAVLLAYPEKNCTELYEMTFSPEKSVPFVAINLTHGTGSEANRFAVVTIPEKDYKPALAADCMYPFYSIDDPALMTGLPASQTRYVSVDAVNHVVEAATTVLNNPFALTTAKETIRLVNEYLPQALENPEDLTARYFLTYAAMIAGISFDNGLLHFTHALEHPLSAVKTDVTHGLGLAVLLPAVVEQSYPGAAAIFAELFETIVPGLVGDPSEAKKAANGVRAWLKSVGITETLQDLGFSEADIPTLVDLAFTTPGLDGLIGSAPVNGDRVVVEAIYRSSL